MANFTIITINYNCSLELLQTISSLKKQTRTLFEYIVIDGKSNDLTNSLIKEISDLLQNNALLLIANSGKQNLFISELASIGCLFPVQVQLGGAINQPPMPIFAPKRQPLPNNPSFFRSCHGCFRR